MCKRRHAGGISECKSRRRQDTERLAGESGRGLAFEEVARERWERHDKAEKTENTKDQNDETTSTKTEECSQNYRCITAVVM